MASLIIKLLLLIIAILVAVLVVRDDPGQLMLRYRDYSVETTLAFAVIALVVSMVAIYYGLKLLRGVLRLPGNIKDMSENRRYARSRRQLNQGLIDLAEGRFEQAENHLMRMVNISENPLVHYLAAARAAQLQGKHDARDNYLKAAHDGNPGAELAIGLTQAELQLAHRQTEQALATLTHLHGVAPKHDYITKLLARAYHELEDWRALAELLPDLRRKKLLKPAQLRELELDGYRGLLRQARHSQADYEAAWSKVPKDRQADTELLCDYLTRFAEQQWFSSAAEQALQRTLDREWAPRLVDIYGRLHAPDPNAQLTRAEKWLADYGQDEHLLLALGRIAMRAKLWGKAQGYFEASIGARANPAACLELAVLLEEQLQQKDRAAQYYEQGLRLALDAGD